MPGKPAPDPLAEYRAVAGALLTAIEKATEASVRVRLWNGPNDPIAVLCDESVIAMYEATRHFRRFSELGGIVVTGYSPLEPTPGVPPGTPEGVGP